MTNPINFSPSLEIQSENTFRTVEEIDTSLIDTIMQEVLEEQRLEKHEPSESKSSQSSKHPSLEKWEQKIAAIEKENGNQSFEILRSACELLLHEIGPDSYPKIRLQIILKFADSLLKTGQSQLASWAYNAAYQFAQKEEADQAEAVAKHLLAPIEAYFKQIGKKPFNTLVEKDSWKRHREALKKIREKFQPNNLESKGIRQVQRETSLDYIELAKDLVDTCMSLLGPAPCKYCFISLGSLSREEICPYSDIECGILYEEADEYFLHLAKLFELHLINLGETEIKIGDPKQGGVCVARGFSMDTGGLTPATLQKMPGQLAWNQKSEDNDDRPTLIYNALREAGFMFGERSLFDEYQENLEEMLTEDIPRYRKKHPTSAF